MARAASFLHPMVTSQPRAPWSIAAVRAGSLALVAALFFLGLGNGSLWDNSEPTYGEVVKEMFVLHDWLSLHYNYAPWYIHPPLWMWTTGLACIAFGLNEFALRFPSALFGVAGAVATYLAGRRLYGEVAGVVSGLALATSLEYIVLARLAILDTMLIFFMTLATLWGYFALRDGDRRAFWIATVAAALGVMTKGPVAIVIPLLVLAAWLFFVPRARRAALRASIRSLPWVAGVALFALLAGWWFALQTILHGSAFLVEYVGRSTFSRYLTPFENQPGPVYYYVPILLLGLFPYVAFLPKAIKEAWRARTSDDIFLLCAAAVPFVFFSVAQTKLPNYLGILLPALSILVGDLVGHAIERNDLRSLRGALIVLPLALVLLTIAIVLYVQAQRLGDVAQLAAPLSLLGWVVVPTTVVTVALTLLLRRAWIAPLGLTVMMAGVVGALVLAVLPGLEARKPMKAMAHHIQSLWRPGDKIAITGVHGGFSLLFYTDAGPIYFLRTETEKANADALLRGPARVYALIVPYEYADLQERHIRVRILERESNMWLVTNR
ncbi:MAG: glycosyltransferase family 39 protein [Candidatus Eremiobacteraeota bacterium]|nr:glycosyltransferase family 39 protein [Candidatus Eremiobacteraeota bacterium]MBV8366417.1 glycosyltransferase family 39 protein [Candidatus Eremiobacteraeota bacterium]